MRNGFFLYNKYFRFQERAYLEYCLITQYALFNFVYITHTIWYHNAALFTTISNNMKFFYVVNFNYTTTMLKYYVR